LANQFKIEALKKIAIITTHPIQYNAPLFKHLAKSKKVHSKIFYTWGETVLQSKYDPGFSKTIEWDVPLLEGYEYEFIENTAREKGSHHYKGIINPGIITKIIEWQPDAILVYGWKFHSHLKIIRHFKNKIPIWFRGDSTLLDEQKNFQSFFKYVLLKWVYKHIDIAFYTGTNNKEYFLNYGLKSNQLIKALHAIDNERFRNINERYSRQALEWKAELKICRESLVFLFAGKMEPKKGIETLLEVFKTISNKDVHLIIAGNGQDEYRLKKKYEGLDNLTFLDFQNQMMMPVVYQLCDVFVLPSTGPGESWGLSINEAMAAGKPVIVSDKCGGAIDLVENERNGFIFKAGDADDLAIKMNTVINYKNEMSRLGKNSLSAIEPFSFQSFVTTIEKLMHANG
jgi:glycosyltransferase involved in cell wall biosynthesis